jgi:hypothetical protein
MKQLFLLTLMTVCLSVHLFAQKPDAALSGVPQGMKYQAVARGISGEILAEKTVNLQINLGSKTVNFYSETHTVVTNSLGLFDLAIGNGKVVLGKFEQIPWASDEIWVSISLDAVGKGVYQLVSSSKLLAVPYAFHAATAGEIAHNVTTTGGAEACPAGTATGTLWSTSANCNAPATPRMGTADYRPVVFVTDYIERMRIAADGNMSINKSLTIGENLSVSGLVRSLNTTESTNCTDGATAISGGLGVAKRANICGDTRLFSDLKVDKNVKIDGLTQSTNTTQSTSYTDGSVVTAGGLGVDKQANIRGDVHLGKDLLVDNKTTMAELVVNYGELTDQTNFNDYPAQIKGKNAGMAIKIDGSRTSDNNFISFFDGNGMQGRIEGETAVDVLTDPEYIFETAIHVAEIAMGAIEIAGAATSTTACAGVGAVVCAPIPSLIVASIAKEVIIAANAIAYQVFAYINLGVTYASASGDYAEWLERTDKSEKMIFGDIVSVNGGKITKTTTNAEQFMVISMKPAVLGNMPPENQQVNYEKVAFMGQVPVRVLGNVAIGDYILPSGLNNGFGIGKKPADMRPEDYQRIVGIAWTASNGAGGMVNLAVGLNANDVAHLAIQQQKQLDSQENRIVSLENDLAELKNMIMNGGKITATAPVSTVIKPIVETNNDGFALDNLKKTFAPTAAETAPIVQMPAGFQSPSVENIDPALIEEGFAMAKKQLLADGVHDLNIREMQSLFNVDGELHGLFVAKLKTRYKVLKADSDAINARH